MTLIHPFKKNQLLLIAIISLASILRLYHLGKQSVWMDEAYSFLMSKDVHVLWFDQIKDSSPPLYYTIVHYWIELFGRHEVSIRSFSVLCGVLLVPLIFIAGKIISNERAAIYAALLAAISPNHIYYSQEARMYSLLAFLSLASFLAFYLSLKDNKRIYWILYIVSTICCLYTHNYGVLLIAAEVSFYVLYSPKKRGAPWKFMLSQIGILAAFSFRIPVIFKQSFMDMNPWITIPTLKDIYATFLHFSLASWHTDDIAKLLSEPVSSLTRVGLFVFAIIFLFGFYATFKKKSLFLPSYLIVPLGVAFIISMKIPIYVAGRYDIVAYPAFCLIAAVGLDKIKPLLLRYLFLAIIITATSISLYHYYFVYQKSNDRTVAEFMQKNVHKEDIVVVSELSITPLEYYWAQEFLPKLFQFPEGTRGFLVNEAHLYEYYAWRSVPGVYKSLPNRRAKETLERELREGKDTNFHSTYVDLEINKVLGKVYPLITKDNKLWLLYQPFVFVDRLLEKLNEEFDNTKIINFSRGENPCQVSKIFVFKRR